MKKSAAIVVLLLLFNISEAAKIGEVTALDWQEQALRFLSLQDPAVLYALWGSIFMGISCGLLGSFLVVRRLALIGDTLSHAVLPGVALGFLWNLTKDPVAIFIGATLAGLIGTLLVNLIQQTTHIKEDSALGMVLAGFYAIGVCLLTMIQKMPSGNKSGIDKFLFGQIAALSEVDIQLMGVITFLTVILILAGYKEFLVSSFDWGFARSLGIPTRLLHYLLMLFLTFAVVVSLQATGVILVSAMLITPAATAYLLTDRMHVMLLLAALFGIASGVVGTFFSFLGNDLPTGPFMVGGATAIFALAFLFGPRYGLVSRWRRRKNRDRRIQIENTLKVIYQVMEQNHFKQKAVSLKALSAWRKAQGSEIVRDVQTLVARGLATYPSESEKYSQGKRITLTQKGWERACQIVRNHRLWELYLTHAADYAADHVHDDAEMIEHILGETTVRDLEKRLNHPQKDPHGKLIPSQRDIEQPRFVS